MLTKHFSEKQKERIFLHGFPQNSPLNAEEQTYFLKILKLHGKWKHKKNTFGLFFIKKSLPQWL